MSDYEIVFDFLETLSLHELIKKVHTPTIAFVYSYCDKNHMDIPESAKDGLEFILGLDSDKYFMGCLYDHLMGEKHYSKIERLFVVAGNSLEIERQAA